MAIQAQIQDRENDNKVQVTDKGQLVVGPAAFSKASFVQLVSGIPVNLWPPKEKHNFIITDIIIKGAKATDAIVTIYESAISAESSTQTKVILPIPILGSESLVVTNQNLEVAKGSWVNAIATDSNVFITVMGYYIKNY